MQKLIVSTCGTSLLTNLAGDMERRQTIIRHANAKHRDQIPEPDRSVLDTLIEQMQQALEEADGTQRARLSAELNGLQRYYDNRLTGQDIHWLIATDTWLGEATAQAIGKVLSAHGHVVDVRRITDLRTTELSEFRVAMSDLASLCAREVRGLRAGGMHTVFNLTGGFKSVQGFMQSLGMLYADESVYVFENAREMLSLPRLPIKLESAVLVREHEWLFRRIAAGLPVSAEAVRTVPETLLLEIDGEIALSVWGEAVWAEAGDDLLAERLWPSVDAKVRFGDGLEAAVNASSADERRQVNVRLGELARHLHQPDFNPRRLDFKKLRNPHGKSTHECDAWNTGKARRLFGHFEHDVFVVDALADGLH